MTSSVLMLAGISLIMLTSCSNSSSVGSSNVQLVAETPVGKNDAFTDEFNKLIKYGNLGYSEAEYYSENKPIEASEKYQIQKMVNYSNAHPDHGSYLILLSLSKIDRQEYNKMNPTIRAAILIDSIKKLEWLNDFGINPAEFRYVPDSMQLLIECGMAATKNGLLDLLNDQRPGPIFGSEEAAVAENFDIRRADYAIRAYEIILGKTLNFDKKFNDRLKAFMDLIKENSN
jgi:hypothetical protein